MLSRASQQAAGGLAVAETTLGNKLCYDVKLSWEVARKSTNVCVLATLPAGVCCEETVSIPADAE